MPFLGSGRRSQAGSAPHRNGGGDQSTAVASISMETAAE